MPPAKRRGLSLEEKRDKILEIFYESKDFFLVRDAGSIRRNVTAVPLIHSISQYVQSYYEMIAVSCHL